MSSQGVVDADAARADSERPGISSKGDGIKDAGNDGAVPVSESGRGGIGNSQSRDERGEWRDSREWRVESGERAQAEGVDTRAEGTSLQAGGGVTGTRAGGSSLQADAAVTGTRGGRIEDDGRGAGATIENNLSEKKEITFSDPRTMPDSERERRGEMLRNAEAIEVASGQIVATKEISARKAAEQWWDENVGEPAFYDTEVGEVEINRNSIESSLAHRYGQMKLDAITSLVEGFENAVYLGTMPDGRERGVIDHYFAYPIN